MYMNAKTTGTVTVFALLGLLGSSAWASNYAIDEIPQAIPTAEAAKLKAAGVIDTQSLLDKGADPKARKTLSTSAKIALPTLQGWVEMADLLRIKGIGPDVARLLAAAGVKTVAQLKSANADKVNDSITKVNSKEKLSENPPSADHLKAWIAQAQTLPIVLK
jgi:predicted flap endonuclease-1-like 5' DNA nuclease